MVRTGRGDVGVNGSGSTPSCVACPAVRLVVARCSVDYVGRLTAHLPMATAAAAGQGRRVGLGPRRRPGVQAAELDEPAVQPPRGGRRRAVWTVTNKAGEQLIITIEEVLHDSSHELGADPGLVKDGVEADLQRLLAEQIQTLGDGLPAGPPGVPDRDRPGRHPLPGRRRRRRSRSRSSAAARSTGSSSSPATSSCSTGTRCWRRCAASSPPRRSTRRPGCSPPTAASPASTLDYDALRGVDDPSSRLF